MKRSTIAVLLVLSLLFVACAKTEVVKIDNSQPENTTATAEQPVQAAPGEVVPVKCARETAGNSNASRKVTDSSGKVTVTYSDGTTKDFIDNCPGNSNIQVKYDCSGNDVVSQNTICSQLCVAGLCIG